MEISSISPLVPPLLPKLLKPFPNLHKSSSSHPKIPIAISTTFTRSLSPLFCSSNKPSYYQTTHKTTSFQKPNKNIIYADEEEIFLDAMYTIVEDNEDKAKNKDPQSSIEQQEKSKAHRGISSNMWWAKVKASLGQRLNLEGISLAMGVIMRDSHLALPHISVKDIRWIDWVEMEKRGFRGVVFDKDNTLTIPYSLTLWGSLDSSLECCKSVFGDNVAVFSNSAGLYQYDGDGSKARAVENSIGVHVIRHGVKKPGGSAEDIEKYFGCSTSQIIMVGDRYFTDIVYGNRNGFLTILTEPLSLAEEPFVVRQVRKLEGSLATYWHRKGLKPTNHSLLSEAIQCVKIPPL